LSNHLRAGISLAAWWLWLPAVVYVVKGVNHALFGGLKWTQTYDLWMFTTLTSGAYLMLFFTVGLFGSAVILGLNAPDHSRYDKRPSDKIMVDCAIVALAATLVPGSLWVKTIWDNDKDAGRYYANSTAFYVENPSSVPDSLQNLVDDANVAEGCDLLGSHDVRGCVRQGALAVEGWDERVSSFTGAQIAIRRKTDGVQRVSLADATVTYLNTKGDQPAVWSGVLDGSGKEQSLYGVAEWAGEGDPKVCEFSGEFAIKRAFNGERGNSLSNLLADRFPIMRWDIGDVWGYCDNDQPIVVVPVTKPIRWMDRTVDTAAGVILVQGNHGDVELTHVSDVKAETYRGPVYPASLVAKQREEVKWAAGRKNMDRFSFGYDPSSSDEQGGNVSEFLFRDKKTDRLVYVTPLTLRSSSSEVFVAYSVTYADEVSSGQLNELSLYVLDKGDKRLINIDQLAAEANDWMSRNVGTFRANGGHLIEFTPIDGDTWRVFGEMGGQVVYRLDISASRRVAPKLVSLGAYDEQQSSSQSDPGQPQDNSGCVTDLSTLSGGDLAKCLRSVTDEASRRLGQN
jgi:hypothetical protein